jgi:hypothetical protein
MDFQTSRATAKTARLQQKIRPHAILSISKIFVQLACNNSLSPLDRISMRVNILLQSSVSEYSFATLSAGVRDTRPTARDAADASRSSQAVLLPLPGARPQ